MPRTVALQLLEITPLDGFRLQVRWRRHGAGVVDLAGVVATNRALSLACKDPAFFSQAHVGEDGMTVQWDDEIEIGADSLYRWHLYQTGESWDPGTFRAWRMQHDMSPGQAAHALGIRECMLKFYEEGRYLVPKTVMLACKGYDALLGHQAA